MDPTTESLLAAVDGELSCDDDEMPVLQKRNATLEDYTATGEGVPALLLDGDLWLLDPPTPAHQQAAAEIGAQLRPAARRVDALGWVILPEINLRLGPHMFGPDLAGWRRSRMPQRPDSSHIEVVPDWVCEILSPSTSRFDKGRKREIYATAGVETLWFVDPRNHSVDILTLTGAEYRVTTYAEQNEKVALPPFIDIELDLSLFWAH